MDWGVKLLAYFVSMLMHTYLYIYFRLYVFDFFGDWSPGPLCPLDAQPRHLCGGYILSIPDWIY